MQMKKEDIVSSHVGFVAWGQGQMGKAVLLLDIWLHILVILFYPMLVSRCNASPQKNYTKEKTKQIRDEDVSFIFYFIYWVQQPFYGWGSFSWIHRNVWIPQFKVSKIR